MTGLICLVLIYFLNGESNRIYDPKRITGKIQEVLNKKDLLRKSEFFWLEKNFPGERTTTPLLFDTRFENLSRTEGIDFFIYKHDTLVWWSTNTIFPEIQSCNNIREMHTVRKLNNGWYDIRIHHQGEYSFLSTILLKNEYPFQNSYLKDGFHPSFNVPADVQIMSGKGSYEIRSLNGYFLFSIGFERLSIDNSRYETLFFIFLIISWISFFVFIYKVYRTLLTKWSNSYFLVLGFTIDVLILRLLQLYFKFPAVLYNTELFGPAGYSSSVLSPSLGDFLINSLCILAIAYVFYRHWPKSKTPRWLFFRIRPLISWIFLIHIFVGFLMTEKAIGDLVTNSSIPLNLQDISSLSTNSIYGLVIICSLILSLWLFSIRFLEMAWELVNGMKVFLLLYGSIAVCSGILIFTHTSRELLISGSFCLIFILLYLCFRLRNIGTVSMLSIVLFLIFFTVFATTLLNISNKNNEQEKRKVLALKLSSRRNPVTEINFLQEEKKILSDSIIKEWYRGLMAKDPSRDDSLVTYLKAHYFKDYWNRFNVQATVCYQNKVLKIQPHDYLINCHDYFQNIRKDYGESTASARLFYIDYGFGNENYLAIFSADKQPAVGNYHPAIFIELNAKSSYKELGYPELLLDQKLVSLPDFSEYGYAFFQSGRLVEGVGKYAYHLNQNHYRDTIYGSSFLVKDGMSHYFQQIDASNAIVISRKQESLLTAISPFSYLFILFSFYTLLFYGFIHFSRLFSFTLNTLRNRLQMAMVGTLLLSFILIGVVLVLYIIRLNSDKNEASLRERALSIRVELQHKIGGDRSLFASSKDNLENLMVKFSNVFFSDINLYNPSGDLVATSRPEIFREGLISPLINPNAYYHLVDEKNSLFIQEENIGRLKYYSAYIPFFNDHANLLGYLNLPYFSRQDDLRREISGLLVAFINIYVLLILLSIFITFIISKYITSPLSLLVEKMAITRIGKTNERISWKQTDEIGRLVEEYNRMIGELELSAERLAQSERESAWREMARQVAHEIKNPLTPMKLSIQYLYKAWKDQAPDWELRLERFSSALMEQIDSLSAIASEFSDFAKMPEPANEKLDIYQEILSVLRVYQQITHIHFECSKPAENLYLWADRKLLHRVFNNLLNNSVQAIGNADQGRIIIEIVKEGKVIIINIADNGMGIAPDQVAKIFQPNFTTKSTGMGLGLAIVKGIVTSLKGNISFSSMESRGTTFSIALPCYEDIYNKDDV